MDLEDIRALEAEIDLCTNIERLEYIIKKIPKWYRRLKKKKHYLALQLDLLRTKASMKSNELRDMRKYIRIRTSPLVKPGDVIVTPPMKELNHVVVDADTGEIEIWGVPVDG